MRIQTRIIFITASFLSTMTGAVVSVVPVKGAVALSPALAVELDELLPPTENGTTSHVTAVVGETALLPCKAYSLGQRTVSWIRRRDWHIITSGSAVYTADARFHVLNRPGSPDWVLMLKWAQVHDSGIFECQISGGQGQVSHFVELRVWAPVAVISEGSEYHIEAESNLKLHCSLRRLAADNGSNKTLPLSVELSSSSHLTLPTVAGGGSPFVWLHNGRPLMNGGKSSGGGSVSIRLDGNQTNWTSWTSRLNIHQADSSDSGNYSCVPWRGETASASVFISQGDRPAAVQRQGALRSSIPLNLLIFGLNLLLLLR